MKKILLTMAFVLTALGNAWADHNFWAHDITIPKGSSATLEIELTNAADEFKQMFQFELVLPDGVTVVPGSARLNNERFVYNDGTGDVVRAGISTNVVDGHDKFVIEAGAASYPVGHARAGKPVLINGTDGIVMTIKLQTTLEESSTPLTGYLRNIEVPYRESEAMKITEKEFAITISSRIALDEDATKAPDPATNVDVMVKRTIKANQLSTICLPFAMTEAQVKAAFGDDVQLFNFNGYVKEENSDEDIVGLTVKFQEVDISGGMEANHPYAILVSTPINEFTVDEVSIAPEDEPTVAATQRTKKKWSEMIGTYVSKNIGSDTDHFLFLNNDKFWYTNPEGKTKIKAFRAYFDFYDVLTEVEDAESRIFFSISDEPTKIGHVNYINADNHTYNLNGQKVNRTNRKGLYIKNGKKVVIK